MHNCKPTYKLTTKFVFVSGRKYSDLVGGSEAASNLLHI